jgi:hypothetical protein
MAGKHDNGEPAALTVGLNLVRHLRNFMATFETICGTGVSENKPARLTPVGSPIRVPTDIESLLRDNDKDFFPGEGEKVLLVQAVSPCFVGLRGAVPVGAMSSTSALWFFCCVAGC